MERQLGLALLGYTLAVVLIVTLVPFQFARPEYLRVMVAGPPMDVVGNVFLFLPLGFLLRLMRPDTPDRWGIRALGFGFAVSCGIESVQLFEVDRYASLSDVLSNGIGAWTGWMLHRRIARRLRLTPGAVGQFALEIPLMGVIYLLIPLLWLNTAGTHGAPGRLWLTLSLGIFGGTLLGSVQRSYLGPAGVLSRRAVTVAAVGWFLLGTFPALVGWPIQIACIALGVASCTGLRASDGPLGPSDRRFEAAAIRAAAPAFAVYLLLLAGQAGFADGRLSRIGIVRWMEMGVAFSILGYLLAEVRGRDERPYREEAPRVALWSGLAAGFTELLRGWGPMGDFGAGRFLLLVASGVYGGWLYHLQRDHIRRLVAPVSTPLPAARHLLREGGP